MEIGLKSALNSGTGQERNTNEELVEMRLKL